MTVHSIGDRSREGQAARDGSCASSSGISSAADAFSNICFRKTESSVIMGPMDVIDIGDARTAAGA